MKLLTESRGGGRRLALLAGALTFAMLAVLAIAARAQATETIYWDNYKAEPPSVAFANIDGAGGGSLNLGGAVIKNPEGMAFDPVSGKIFIASPGNNQILWAAADGTGGGVLDTGTAPVMTPEGIAVDPKTQIVYWANDEELGSIGYASANGGGGGSLNTTGAEIEDPYKIALDTTSGRVYWISNDQVYFANLNNTGGGSLGLPEAELIKSFSAINVDPAAGRLYYIGAGKVRWVSTIGLGGGEVDITGAAYQGPYGLAFDPSNSRFYWANYGNTEIREGAIGTALLSGGGGGIDIATAPLDGPQDPLVLKSPTGTGAPQVTRNVAALSCSPGTWSQDYPGSFVYGAPASYSYQWLLNGQAIPGATNSSLTATAPGAYSCSVTGKNVTGSATQTSASTSTVTAAALSLALKGKKIRAKAGKTVTVRFGISNAGDLSSAPVQICAAKLTKKAKKGLVAPKCASVAPLASGGSAVATLKVKTKKTAKGAYKFTTKVKGASVKPVTVSVKVIGAKKHKKKHHKK